MANRYIPGSKLSDAQIEALLWSVCTLQTIAQGAHAAGVSKRTAGQVMRRLREMIANAEALFAAAGLPTDWPESDTPYWAELHACIFACPSEIREERKVFGHDVPRLKGDRRLCASCPHQPLLQPRPLLLRTLQHLKNAQRGMPPEGFRAVFLIVLLYDRYREIELERALSDPEAMKRFGSTRHNHMTMMYEACRESMARPKPDHP